MTAPTAPAPVAPVAPVPAPVDVAGTLATTLTGQTAPVAAAPVRTREEVWAAISAGTSPAVKRGHPEVPGEAAPVDAPVIPAAVVDHPESATVVDPATTETVAAPVGATPAPTQADLEKGQDVGSGDALFRVRDPVSGQFVENIPHVYELAIRDADTGEVRTYAKTPQELARMARDGVAGQKHFQKLQQIERDVIPQITRERDTLREQFEAQVALNREILGDEERYLARREQYLEDTSPQSRAHQVELENQHLRAQMQARDRSEQANHFYTTRIQPVVAEAIAKTSPELVLGRMNLDTAHLTVNGVVPPARWNELEAYVRGPFTQWLQQVTSGAAQRTAAADTATTVATQKANQRAVNQTARALQPVGGAGPADAPKALPPPKNRQEALDRILARPMGA